MNARASALFDARGDDADAVPHRRLGPRGQLDDADVVLHRRRVGAVDETGVGLAERHLREHAAHVRLLADDVRQHRGADAEVAQDLPRVVADGDALSGDHDLDARPAEVEHRLHVAGIRLRVDDDELVRREDPRLAAEPRGVESLRVGGVGGGEHVCRRSLPDLLCERVRRCERELLARVDLREDVGQRRGGIDGDLSSRLAEADPEKARQVAIPSMSASGRI